jgi:putative hydrolase of the HAD superfamily
VHRYGLGVIEAVTFDFWNTLVFEERGHLRGRRLAAWAGILEEAGFGCERRLLDAAFDDSWQAYVRAWKANDQFLAVQGAEHCLETLGFDVPPDVRDALITAFTSAGDDAELQLTDGVADCLRLLRDRGTRLGIICDVGMTPSATLRAHLDRSGVLELFDHWSFSDEVGWYKPAKQIFEHALAGLGGVAPARTAHVGDIRRTDIAGARAMGMVAVRYTGVSDDDTQAEPEGDHVIAQHRELPAVLGID